MKCITTVTLLKMNQRTCKDNAHNASYVCRTTSVQGPGILGGGFNSVNELNTEETQP